MMGKCDSDIFSNETVDRLDRKKATKPHKDPPPTPNSLGRPNLSSYMTGYVRLCDVRLCDDAHALASAIFQPASSVSVHRKIIRTLT